VTDIEGVMEPLIIAVVEGDDELLVEAVTDFETEGELETEGKLETEIEAAFEGVIDDETDTVDVTETVAVIDAETEIVFVIVGVTDIDLVAGVAVVQLTLGGTKVENSVND